jgi:hypothetical protein
MLPNKRDTFGGQQEVSNHYFCELRLVGKCDTLSSDLGSTSLLQLRSSTLTASRELLSLSELAS